MRGPRFAIVALVTASAVGALAPTDALAHAVLQGTEPARGATIERAPEGVTFRFSEPVEGSFGAVRIFDARGERVDAGELVRPGGRSSEVAAPLRPGLGAGTYTATYRVISADSHPISGGFVFLVGAPGEGPARSVSELIAEEDPGLVTQLAFGVARWLDYAAIALGLGALAFLAFVWRPALASVGGPARGWRAASEAFARRSRRLLATAVVVGVLSGLLGIVLQGVTAAGISFWGALDPGVLREVLGTRFGTVWGLRVLAWLGLGAALLLLASVAHRHPRNCEADSPCPRRPRVGIAIGVLALPLTFLAVSPALAGHASTQSPSLLLVPVDVVHVVAMSVWIGGLAMLLLALPAATRQLEPGARSRLLAASLVRFSPLALIAVAALLVSGLVQSYVHIRSLENVFGTPFGRAAAIKLGLLALLIALGALNRYRLVPSLREIARVGGAPGRVGRLLRRTLRVEVALLVAVLGVTSALVSYPPATAEGSGPFSASRLLGPARLELTVDPARLGPNEIHLYLIDAADGSQYTATRELRAALTLPAKGIGPLPVEPERAGPGHFVVPASPFGVAGDWRLEVTSRVSEFDEYQTSVQVPIR